MYLKFCSQARDCATKYLLKCLERHSLEYNYKLTKASNQDRFEASLRHGMKIKILHYQKIECILNLCVNKITENFSICILDVSCRFELNICKLFSG